MQGSLPAKKLNCGLGTHIKWCYDYSGIQGENCTFHNRRKKHKKQQKNRQGPKGLRGTSTYAYSKRADVKKKARGGTSREKEGETVLAPKNMTSLLVTA